MSIRNIPTILIDAGPLIAIFATEDKYHAPCSALAKELDQSFYTTLPVFTEAMYFANKRYGKIAVDALWEMVFDQLIQIETMDMSDYRRSALLMDKYSDTPMDFADASLVVLGERIGIDTIFTIDRRHFSVYKIDGRKSFTIIGP